MFQDCTKMVLENVVIMGCCNKKLCSRSEYLAGGRGGGEAQNRETAKGETTRVWAESV